jgi:hypothetical protein
MRPGASRFEGHYDLSTRQMYKCGCQPPSLLLQGGRMYAVMGESTKDVMLADTRTFGSPYYQRGV